MYHSGRFCPVQYQPAGERKKRRTAWFHPDHVAASKAWLEEKLGPLAAWEPPPSPAQIIDADAEPCDSGTSATINLNDPIVGRFAKTPPATRPARKYGHMGAM